MDTRGTIRSLFGTRRALIGVIHVGALPGAPRGNETVDALATAAAADARAYREAGFSGLMVENIGAGRGPGAASPGPGVSRRRRRARAWAGPPPA
jgi:hypothetical protein